jgi:hypothetical protein
MRLSEEQCPNWPNAPGALFITPQQPMRCSFIFDSQGSGSPGRWLKILMVIVSVIAKSQWLLLRDQALSKWVSI